MKTRTELKNYFSRGATPTEEQFGFLIDSSVNVTDDFSDSIEYTTVIDFESDDEIQNLNVFDTSIDKVIITSVSIYMGDMVGTPSGNGKYIRFRSVEGDILTLVILNEFVTKNLSTVDLSTVDASTFNIVIETPPDGVTSFSGKVYIKYYKL